MPPMVMAYTVMAYVAAAYTFMAHIVMARTVIACVLAHRLGSRLSPKAMPDPPGRSMPLGKQPAVTSSRLHSHGLYSYGLYSCGLYIAMASCMAYKLWPMQPWPI